MLLAWSRSRAGEHTWVIEDCRHVSRPFEHGETVVRLPPRLMADARRGVRERGKSDPIDALTVARAAIAGKCPSASWRRPASAWPARAARSNSLAALRWCSTRSTSGRM
jgi:transposase